METRRRRLPAGWYPEDGTGVSSELRAMEVEYAPVAVPAIAAVAPHASWTFSGALAWAAWRSAGPTDTVVVIGGHLPAGAPFLAAMEDAFETPTGLMRADAELRDAVVTELSARPDVYADNTVEIHLPMARTRFPDAKLAWFRAPNEMGAARLGEALAAYARTSGRTLFVMGSTDLTHYGPNYGFEPGGRGTAGRAWAREGDHAIAAAFAGMDAATAVVLADDRRAACSVGAAVAAMAYAAAIGRTEGRTIGEASSWDLMRGDSFVGYCSVVY